METRLDKLFKDQLSKHEEIPSPQAWDQIHGQLASNRRKVWGRRLAIAASILLFATAGFFGYRSLNTITIKDDQFVIKSIDENKNNEDLRISNLEEEISENIIPQDIKEEDDIKTDERQEVIAKVKSIEKIAEALPKVGSPAIKVAGAHVGKTEIQNDIKVEELREISEDYNLSEQSIEVVLAENEAQEIPKIIEQKKSYPRVTIIYKADKNSELVASGKKTLLDKGINELTRFSDEHLLTADRKTMLRNTKDELLALNFGRLLTKSNKETKN